MTNKLSIALALIAGFALSLPVNAQEARLQLDQLNHLGSRAKETVEVTMDRPAVQLVAKLATLNGNDRNKLRDLAARLQGLYVRGYEFEREGEFSEADVEAIRMQLRAPGWQRIVQVRGRAGENNEVYFMPRAEVVEGVAIISTESKCLCVINVVGSLSLDEFSLLDREFGVTKCGARSHQRRIR
jgi:hypothetical protein